MTEYRMPERKENSNKGTFGKILNFCGSPNYIGAAYLSTISSLKVGAGFSALATTQDVINSVSSILPEAVYLTRSQGLKDINNYTVILAGCGLGQSYKAKNLIKNILKKINPNLPLIIDADGLNIISNFNNITLPPLSIITPHPLEASRLLKCSLEDVLNNLENSAKKLSQKYNCITILKTHRTIICNTDLTLYINQHGNSALAKAGSGDVLAGILAGLVAQGVNKWVNNKNINISTKIIYNAPSLFELCKLGVYLHSRTGEIASEELTKYSVLASDLPKFIHKAIKEINQ